ncbi:MAG TPA: aspartyl protease family protein [Steroidobacteraceae bacterium]|nr:aspartyl protease family protein [Steroidobacteraceae bacterium]
MTISGTRPLIDAKINGQDVQLLVDSGASFSMISAAMAKQLNLRLGPAPPGFSIRGVGGKIDISVGTAKVFRIANVDVPNVDFLVGGSEAGGGSSGVLGQNFLVSWNVEYDLAKGLIRIFKDTDCSKQFLAYWGIQNPERVTVTNIDKTTLRSPHAIGHAFVNGEKIRVLFDSGAFKSVLSIKAAQRAGLKLDSPEVIDGGETSGIGRNLVKSYIAPFASFRFADGEEIKNARLRVADIDLDLADMLVGADFFLSHRIFIANSQEKVYFTYNGGPVFDLRNTSKPASVGPAGDESQAAEAKTAQSDSKAAPQAPEDASALARRGIASTGRSDYTSALADLTRATELAPDNPEYIYQRGQVHRWRKEYENAVADYGRALQLSPDFVPALMSRAELRIDMRNVPEARADLEAVDRIAAKQADIRYAMAEDYERADLLPLAIAQFDLWIVSHPEDSRIGLAFNGRCKARGVLGQDLPMALKDCNAAVSRSGTQVGAGVLVNRALVRYRLGDYDRAIADYDAALKLQPKSAWALYGRGLVKLKKNQRAEGDNDMAEAVKIAPNVVDGYKRMGLSP